METENKTTGQVYIIYGPPGAGKTTEVQRRMKEGDLVVDLDYICAALSLGDIHKDHTRILGAAMRVRDFIIDAIGRRTIPFDNAYIITTKNEYEIYKQTGGKMIEINPGLQTVLKQIENDPSSGDDTFRNNRVKAALEYYRKNDKYYKRF